MSRLNPLTCTGATPEPGNLRRMGRRLNRRSIGAAAVAVAVIAGLSASGAVAGATPTYKIYTATATPLPPSSLYVGVSSPVSVTLSNSPSSNQPFGSAELTIPGVPQSDIIL